MQDKFDDYIPGLESPATDIINIIPDDTADLVSASRAINVAETGTVRITTITGTTATVFIAAGIPFPVRASRIWDTGTTATGIVALS